MYVYHAQAEASTKADSTIEVLKTCVSRASFPAGLQKEVHSLGCCVESHAIFGGAK